VEEASVQPGDVIADKYRVERVIGRGGMGVVAAAVHVELGSRVALKFLLPAALANKEAVVRFEREARACVALQSDHVSRVLDVGRLPDGAPYMVMELLEGMDLAHELHRRGGKLPVHEAVSFIVQACDAIAEAHALGIVHRDLKPSNLFLAKRAKKKDAIIKVLDFGISKPTSLTESPTALTGTSDLIGSPLYMSPEQLRAPKTVDGRSDVWSLAATLYELVCGAPPFDGATMAELSANILVAPLPDVRARLPDAPHGFPEVIVRALAKDPAARYESAEAFAEALAPFAELSTNASQSAGSSPALTPPRVEHTLPLLPRPTTPVTPVSNPRLPETKPEAKVVSDAALSISASTPTRSRSPALVGVTVTVVSVAVAVAGVVVGVRSKDQPKAAPLVASPAAPPSAPASASASSASLPVENVSAVPPAIASASASAPVVAARPPSRPAAAPSSPAPTTSVATPSSASAAPATSKPKGVPMELNP
jgi:serine/threonine protein kinase